MAESTRVLITLCTYNERENLELLIPEIFRYVPHADLLIVDDNSPDGTGRYAAELARDNPRIHLLQRPGKLGLGTATMAAFDFALKHDYTFVINLDADFSHPPRFLPALLAASENFDVVIGSRYVPGGTVVGWGPRRHFMSRGINLYARLMLGLHTRDNSGSFRCYRVSKLREVDWSQAKAKGYAVQEEILYRLRCVGATFCEVPIDFEERRFGQTKINWKEAVSAGWVLLRLRLLK
ncbi:polyprenol monophosphomannose synthase [Planctomicrobium sp. SH664]|uniref:polyprenol monophosphomannose synthase n=1 Tax=Planctomicrobium sp. SH664 TaxID=3448125 RepID=UPI003F5B5F01